MCVYLYTHTWLHLFPRINVCVHTYAYTCATSTIHTMVYINGINVKQNIDAFYLVWKQLANILIYHLIVDYLELEGTRLDNRKRLS